MVIRKTESGEPLTLLDSIEIAPRGTRFLTFDYLVSTVIAEDGEGPAIEPRVFALGVNFAAIYNAFAIGNAALYHDVALGSEVLYGVAAVQTSVTFGKTGFIPNDVQNYRHPSIINLSDRYLESNLHSFLRSKGIGSSRERMLLKTALQQKPVISGKDYFVVKYDYRGTGFEVTAEIDDQANRVTVADGEIGN